MGDTRKRLHKTLKKKVASLNLPTGKMRGRADRPSIEAWIKEGMDPVHAANAFVQHISSAIAEGVSHLPEMKNYARIVGAAEDEYMPSGPPMSPLTASFFTTWAFYDLRFDGTDTLATCLIEANDVVCMNPDQLDALKKLTDSRMGVYEQVGTDGPHVRLRELVTDADLAATIQNTLNEVHVLYVEGTPAGFAGLDRRKGDDIKLVQFGLMPEFIGQGLGRSFLQWVIDKAWSYQPRRFWLHTCTLDHPAALPNYLKAGFTIYKEETIKRELPG
jgi:GNAT superfamily N-acetyltransferase